MIERYLDKFFLLGNPPATLLQGQHEPWLVLLSVFMAMVGSTIALQLAGVARQSGRRLRMIAVGSGAVALGASIWSMHFIGMLAYKICTHVSYDLALTTGSMLPGMAASFVALHLLTERELKGRRLIVGGTLVGAGIGAMHYCGMAAMEMAPQLRYEPFWFVTSIAVAVVLAVLALWVRFGLRYLHQTPFRAALLGGVAMGLAISGMHYTAMIGVRLIGEAETDHLQAWSEERYLALSIAFVSVLISALAGGLNAFLRMRMMFQELGKSESRLQGIVDTAVDGIIQINAAGLIQAYNLASERMFGWRADEVLGRNISMLMPEPYRSQHDGYLSNYLRTSEARIMGVGREVQGQRKDGSVFPIRLAIGQVVMSAETLFVGIVSDITTSKAMEAALRESESQYRTLMANIPGVTFRRYRDSLGQYWLIFISDAIERLTGWPASAFLGGEVSVDELIHPAERSRIDDCVEYALRNQSTYVAEYRILGRGGQEHWVSETATAVLDETGQGCWLDGVIIDITEAKQRSAEYEGVVKAIHRAMAVVELDMNGQILDVNENYLKLSGYDREDLVNERSLRCLHESGVDDGYDAMWEALRRGEYQSGEFQRWGKHGKVFWIHATYNPILDADGHPVRVIKLVNDLTERRAMETDLRLAKETAEQAARAKSTFLANMSHEIRTPMNAIIGFTEVLQESALSSEQRRYLDTISRSARTLLGLLNDILDTAKLEHGSVELEVADFSLPELCRDILDTLRVNAEKRGLSLALDYAGDVGEYFCGDALRIQQVLLNLISNAIKFTPRGGVTLSVARVANSIEISVLDTGIGIQEDRLARIFDPFAQADASMTRRYGGTGLGTTIARQFVELMGGEIGVESTLGVGSRFWVRLPLPVGQRPQHSRDDEHRPDLPSLRILVADDVPQNLELLELRLGALGHQVITAADGEEACARVESEPAFDLILMDMQMPTLDGISATRRIRLREQSLGLAPVPVLALTANVLEEDRLAAAQAGMNGFCVKPVEMHRLLAEIARVLGAVGTEGGTAHCANQASVEDGVDWARGVSLWGDVALMRQQIRKFVTDTLASLPEILLRDDRQALRAAAHRIQGAAGNLAMTRIRSMAQALEQQAENAPLEMNAWQALVAELEALQWVLGAGAGADGASAAPSTTVLSHQDLESLLTQLQRGELDDKLLARVCDGLEPDARAVLQTAVDEFDFDRAIEQLQAHLHLLK